MLALKMIRPQCFCLGVGPSILCTRKDGIGETEQDWLKEQGSLYNSGKPGTTISRLVKSNGKLLMTVTGQKKYAQSSWIRPLFPDMCHQVKCMQH